MSECLLSDQRGKLDLAGSIAWLCYVCVLVGHLGVPVPNLFLLLPQSVYLLPQLHHL
jgi:hypothetical protein